MAYQIKCDGYILDDVRDDELTVADPIVNLEVNTVGSCTFTIKKNHPYYDKLKKLKSVFEVSDDVGVIFRGRMLEDVSDIYNSKSINLEGVMAYFNDSIIRPFSFPEDFLNNNEYQAAAASGNVVAFFLKWLINRHNEQTSDFQHFRLGTVTVTDPSNYITRSNAEYASTWETLKSKLFDSALGGYLCIRYEPDGNYIDYLADFTLVNTQDIVFGENLLDLKSTVNADSTYSVILPLGAKIDTETTDESGDTVTTSTSLTIASLPDGNITEDLVKSGDVIYSRSAVEAYGWVCAPVSETTWEDVTEAVNLRTKAAAALGGSLCLLSETIETTALDQHFSEKEIQSFRIYRKVNVRSEVHGHVGVYDLPKLTLNLHNPQNTQIVVGKSVRTLLDINDQKETETANRIESAEKDIEENRTQTSEVKNQMTTYSTELVNTCDKILQSAMKAYVETSTFGEFKKTLQTQLEVWAEGISGRVTATEESVKNVDGDLQEKFNQITKYFTFDINGLTIGQVDNPNKVVIDNDQISILVSNHPVQEFKADGTSLIPILNVTKKLDLLGLQITEDATNINCDYVGVV